MHTMRRISFAALHAAALYCAVLFGTVAVAQNPPPLASPDINLVQSASFFAAARQPDGGTIVSGLFSSVNGIALRTLVRLRPDGTLDPDWRSPIAGLVVTIAADPAGNLYVGGAFQGPDFQRLYLAKLLADGSFDATWDPAPDAIVERVALDGAGSLYAYGGNLAHAGGQPNAGIAKLSVNGTGAADPKWMLGGRTVGFVRVIAANRDAVYVGGQYTEIGGRPRTNLAKLSSNGAINADWNPAPNYDIFALAPVGDAILIGGTFNTIAGKPAVGLVKLAATGSGVIDMNWSPPLGTDSVTQALAVDPTGWIYAGGHFSPNDSNYRQAVKLALADGAPDATWAPQVSGGLDAVVAGNGGPVVLGGAIETVDDEPRLSLAALTAGATLLPATDLEERGIVYAVAQQPDGGMIVGGTFHRANGLMRHHLLRIAADGTLDANWNPMPDRRVTALAVDRDGSVFAGGAFYRIGGEWRNAIAKLGGGGSGAVDPIWNPSLDGSVAAFALDSDRQLYVGGAFRHAGASAHSGLVRLSPDGTGSADAWNPSIAGNVGALALGRGGALYASGSFTAAGASSCRGIAKIATTTALADAGWCPSIDGYVGALAVADDETLYIGGNFSSVNGTPLPSLARLHPNGAPDAAWKPIGHRPGASYNNVAALALDGVGGIYAGGVFDSVTGGVSTKLARYFVTGAGAADPNWNPLPNDSVNALALTNDAALLVGGMFREIGGASRDGVAALPRSDTIFADRFERVQ